MATQLILVGGFLGAGKTTAILALAEAYSRQGKKVAVVTNDQSANLVDSALVRQQGLPVLEVTSGCFCCNFYDFADRLRALCEQVHPDVILAEPVGSCTDLVSTIAKPVRAGKAGDIELSPLSVLVDPARLLALDDGGDNPFRRDEVPYLFFKQLEEAQAILLNKVDALSPQQKEECANRLRALFPNATLLCVSAKTGEGMDEWMQLLCERPAFDQPTPEVDYDTYAAAEAALGWLNTDALLEADRPVDCNALVRQLAESLREKLSAQGGEIAHLKLSAEAQTALSKASCVSLASPVSMDSALPQDTAKCRLILNVRAACDPDTLQSLAEACLQDAAAQAGARVIGCETACFAPSYPNPIFRM